MTLPVTNPLRRARGLYLRMRLTRGTLSLNELSMDDILAADVAWVLEFMETQGAKRGKDGTIADPAHACPPEARRLARHLAKLLRYFMPELTQAERAALMAADGSPQCDLNRLVSTRVFHGRMDDAQMYATLAQGACKGKYPLLTTYKLLTATLRAADAGRIGTFMPDFLRDGTRPEAIVARADRHVAWCIKNVNTLGDEKPANVIRLDAASAAANTG